MCLGGVCTVDPSPEGQGSGVTWQPEGHWASLGEGIHFQVLWPLTFCQCQIPLQLQGPHISEPKNFLPP